MASRKIKGIFTRLSQNGGAVYVVNQMAPGFVTGESYTRRIGEIRDLTLEYEDSIYSCYEIIDESGNIITKLVDMPVVVDYYTQEEGGVAS